jgi:hypothetical protein
MTIDVPPSEISRWRAVARVLRSPLDALSCALLPASCTLCGSPLPQLSSAPICNACWLEFPAISGPCCACCGDTLDRPVESESHNLCRMCRMAAPKFVRAVSFGLYEGRMKQAIHALKYRRIHPAARRLGKMLATAIGQLASEAPAEMLVVPCSAPSRQARRTRFQPGKQAGRTGTRQSAQDPSRLAAHAGSLGPRAPPSHTESGRPQSTQAPPQHARSVQGSKSRRRRRQRCPGDRRHSHHRSNRARSRTSSCESWCRIGLGGDACTRTPLQHIQFCKRFGHPKKSRELRRCRRRSNLASEEKIARPTIFLTRGERCRWEKL